MAYNENQISKLESRFNIFCERIFTGAYGNVASKYELLDAIQYSLYNEINRPFTYKVMGEYIVDAFRFGYNDATSLFYAADDDLSDEVMDIAIIDSVVAMLLGVGEDISQKVYLELVDRYSLSEIERMSLQRIRNELIELFRGTQDYRIDLFARTLINDIYNYSALRTMLDEGIWWYQFVATIDERTTPICRMLHGTIFDAYQVNMYRPPLHYRCRSRIAPLGEDIPEQTELFLENRDFTRVYDEQMNPYQTNITQTFVDTEFQRLKQFRQQWNLSEELLNATYNAITGGLIVFR